MAKLKITDLSGNKKISRAFIKKLAAGALRELGLLKKKNIDLNIVFVRDTYIKKLNRRYKHRDAPTDVLCFCMRWKKSSKDKGLLEADIFISSDTAAANARRFRTIFLNEICLYVIHGILHMAGFNDNTSRGMRRMQKMQESLLAKLVYR